MKHLLRYLKNYKADCILSPLFKLIEAFFDLLVPFVIAVIIDSGIKNSDSGVIIRYSLYLVALSLAGLTFSVTAQYFAARASVGFSSEVRSALFSKIQRMSYRNLDRTGIPSLITRMNSDVNQVQNGVNLFLRLLLRSPFIVVGAVILALSIDFGTASGMIVMVVILVAVIAVIMGISIPLYRKVQGATDRITEHQRENLTGVRILRGFNKQQEEIRKNDGYSAVLEKAQMLSAKVSALLNPVTYLIVNGFVMLLLYTGALRIDSGALSQGQLIAIYNYVSQILVELIKFANLIIIVTRSLASAGRVSRILTADTDEANGDADPYLEKGKGDEIIRFDNVSFRYGSSSQNAVEDISFSVKKGQTVGIIGPTGSGKSTLVSMIPALYVPDSGSVFLFGKDVREYDTKKLRRFCSVVEQSPLLFSGTIRENLLFRDPEATDEEIMEAVRASCSGNIIEAKEEKLGSRVEHDGRNFSGGQKQRLSIARAIMGSPGILILDDSSSSLDYATDAEIRRSLSSLGFSHTTFIVSQRPSSVISADLIIVMDNGKIAGMGTHKELLASCPLYREMYDIQYSPSGGDEGVTA